MPVRRCGSGQIRRKAFTTRRGTRVSATCIRDLGKPGRGPKLIPPLNAGKLRAYGYSTTIGPTSRRAALRRAMRMYGRNSVLRKLNAVKVLTRNTNPRISAVFGRDLAWVQQQ
jgi:hypothetical protein